MNISSSDAQIRIETSSNTTGANIKQTLTGYGAEIECWGGVTYLCKLDGSPFPILVMAPGPEWYEEVRNKYHVIANLNELYKANKAQNPS